MSIRLLRPLRRLCTTAATPPPPPPPRPNPEETQTTLHHAILSQVPIHGFTDSAIRAAITSLNWSPATFRLLPRGPVDVVDRFIIECDRELAEKLAKEDLREGLKPTEDVTERAAFAIRTRIQMQEPFHAHWPQALALHMAPKNASKALRQGALVVDEIAHFAGYRNPDFSWYTDRAVLAVAYQATQLYWLSDKSSDREDTWRFLERRLKDSHATRTQAASAYNGFMTLSDAALGSLSTLVRSTRRSY